MVLNESVFNLILTEVTIISLQVLVELPLLSVEEFCCNFTEKKLFIVRTSPRPFLLLCPSVLLSIMAMKV